jgi:hypothetical protein
MSEFKKTLQDGTPKIAAHPMVTPGGASQAPRPPSAGAVPPTPIVSQAPSSPGYREPQPSYEGPPSSGATNLPPPPGKEELNRSRPPAGRRTPSATREAPDFGPPMAENAAGWMLRARRMSLALEEAIKNGTPSPALEAGIERAWAALELDGSSDKQISRVARLVEKAHTAIRETKAQDLERAYHECAQVLWAGLPRHVKARQDFAQVSAVVRDLRNEADGWAAVVDAVAKLLGWSQAARAHAAHAVRVAILSERTP